MDGTRRSGARETSMIATTAALYFTLFFVSGLITVPRFTLLYLPVVVLGVFPAWFGWSGLVGSMIGAFVGGAYVEGLGFLGVIESVTAFIIYGINWFLISKVGVEKGTRKGPALLVCIYASSLFVGTGYILWQDTVLGIIPVGLAEAVFLPTFGLNLAIQSIVCPALIRILSQRVKGLGIHAGGRV